MFGYYTGPRECWVEKNDKRIKYTFVIPGVNKEDIEVILTGYKLSVSTKKKTVYGQMFNYIDSYQYCKNYNVEEAKSKLQNGVLTIRIPAKEKIQEKSYSITIE